MASTEGDLPPSIMSAEWTMSVRRKTFAKWMNAHCHDSLIKPCFMVENIFNDLRDGTILCSIMSHHTGRNLTKHRTADGPLEWKQKIENVEQVILEVNSYGVCLFSGRPDKIVDGDQEATLELVWRVICIVQLSICDESGGRELDKDEIEKEMRIWVQGKVTLFGLKVDNFSTSWSDGKAFCAVINGYNAATFKYQEVIEKEPAGRLEYAFEFARDTVQVQRLLDVEDVAVSVPDDRCILTYLSHLRKKLVFRPEELDVSTTGLEIWERVDELSTKRLPDLEDKLGEWGPPAQNEVILRQNDELKELESNFDDIGNEIVKLEARKEEEGVNLQQLEAEFKELKICLNRDREVLGAILAESESCCVVVRRFQELVLAEDSVVRWLKEAKADVEGLLALAKDADAQDKARDSLLSIQKAAVEIKPKVDELLHLAADFAEKRKKLLEVLVEKLYDELPTSDNEEGNTLEEQASKVLQDWEWILNQCIKVLQEWFMEVLTWTFDEDFSSTREKREVFLHNCNNVFDVVIRIPGTSGLHLPPLRQKHKDANDHWNTICAKHETETTRRIGAKTLEEINELSHWVKGCLDELASQRPLANTLEGVKMQKQWHQEFLQRVADRETEVQRYKTLRVTGYKQPQDVRTANEIERAHELLGKRWMKLQQKKLAWGKLLDSCVAAWERCNATEGGLRSLEEVHARWEIPADNQDILVQLKEMETFQTSRVVPFKSEVSAMTEAVAQLKSLGGHPPVDDLCRSVSERYDLLVSTVDTKCTVTQECCQVVQEFDQVREPFSSWLTPAAHKVIALFPVPREKVSRDNSRTALSAIQKEAQDRKPDVDRLKELAHTFSEKREVLMRSLPGDKKQAASTSTMPSLSAQADYLVDQWQYILKQVIGYLEIISFHPAVPKLSIGRDFSLIVYTKDVGEGELTADVQGEVSGHINCTVKREDSEIWLVTFRVLKLEKFTIRLFWSGTEIPSSPMQVLPPDASAVKVTGPAIRDMSVVYICDITNAGFGELSANCRSSRFENVHTEVADGNGNVEVSFVPPGIDRFSLSILWDGIHVPGSPFDVKLAPDASKVKVDGPHPCPEGTGPVHTYIDASEAGDGDLQVQYVLSHEEGGPVEVTLTEEQPGHFAAVFEAGKPGTYNVHVMFGGKPVPNSPFGVLVEAKELVDMSRIVVRGFDGEMQFVGESVCFTVDCSQAGCIEPRVTSETPPKGKGKKKHGKKANIDLSEKDSDWGVFEGTFIPMIPGEHKIHVEIAGKALPNSPFIVKVAAQQEKPEIIKSSVHLFGYSETPKSSLHLRGPLDSVVNLDLALPSTVGAVSGYAKLHPSDDELQVTLKKTAEPGQFRCSFWPSAPGVYKLHVLDPKTKKHVAGSPFEVIVLDPSAPKRGHALFQTHNAALKFIVHTDDLVTASCTGNTMDLVKAEVGRKPDNTGWVQIRLKEPDLYTMEVKTGSKQFPGSPFSFDVLPPLTHDDPRNIAPEIPSDPVKLGQPYSLTVLTHGAGDGELTAKVEGSKSGAVPFEIGQVETNKWVVSFLVERTELYMVYLYWNGADVPNTPVKVHPSDASKCRLHHLPSEGDRLLTHSNIVYCVDATKAGQGELTVKCEGPSVASQHPQVDIVPPSDCETSYQVVYTPTASGAHKHNVFWSGEPIPHSPVTFTVSDEEEEGTSRLYSDAKKKLDEFFAATEPQLQKVDAGIHAQPDAGDQGSHKRRKPKVLVQVLPVILLQQLEVISKEKAVTEPYYETFMREGQKLHNISSSNDTKKEVKRQTEQYHKRWLQVVDSHSGLDRECRDLQLRFQTFLDNLLALAMWLYNAWSKLMPDEETSFQVTSGANGDGPGDQWSSVKAAEEGLPLQKSNVTSLHQDGAIWDRLPLLDQSFAERFPKAFVEEFTQSQHTSPPLFQDGISKLQQRLSDLEQYISIFKLIWDASQTLDEILRWITGREAQYGTCLSATPTQDTHTGRQHVQELKCLAQDLSGKATEKGKALTNAEEVLRKTGPNRGEAVRRRVEAVVTAWTRVHKGCEKVKTVLLEYQPKMESLWDKIEHCEKRLDEMDCNGSGVPQLDQVDSATHTSTLKTIAHTLSDVAQSVKGIRAQWKELTKSCPSLKDKVPSVNDPSGKPAFDAEGRIRAIEKRLKFLQSWLSEQEKDADRVATDLQKFIDDLQKLIKWFQWARDATIPEARPDVSTTSLMEQLQKLAEFEETLVVKQGEIPPLQTRAELLSQTELIPPLLRLSTEVEAKCANRKQFLENLISRWKTHLATAEALLDWAKETKERLSEVIADKDNFGVEDHLATCEEILQSISKKAVEFGQFQGVAASFEVEVRGEGWDSAVVTEKNAEVQQSRVSLLDCIDETQAQLKTVADRLKELQRVVTDEQAWLSDVSKRCLHWRPCLGDVRIVQSELDMAEGLLAETNTHDDAIKQLRDNADFMIEHSRPDERKPVNDAIVDICQRHADLKKLLQDKVSKCQTALPLWQRFAATTIERTRWMDEKETLLSSPSMMPSPSSGEEDGKAERIRSVQRELEGGKDKLQLLKSLDVDLTKVCDMEEDRSYIAKRCADLRAQYDYLVKKARDALALCNICERLRQLQHCIQQHRSLPSPSAMPGPELEKRHKRLLDDSKALVQETQNALKNLRKAVQAAQKGGTSIVPEVQQAVDTATADAEQLPVVAKSWRDDLVSRYNAWTKFREGLGQYIQSATDLHTRVETEIDARPIGVFLKDLDDFKKELKTMVSQTQATEKGLAPLQKSVGSFLFGDSQPVKELHDAFTVAIQQQKETADCLEVYLNRVASWEEYFDLLDAALGWFDPFKQVAESDIDKFKKEEESQKEPSRVKLQEHISVMDAKCGMVYSIRDFPLPIADVQSEKESVQDIVHQRDVFVDEFEQLRKRLIVGPPRPPVHVPPLPPPPPCLTCRQLLLLIFLLLFFLCILFSFLVLSWLHYTCNSCSRFNYYTITPAHVPI